MSGQSNILYFSKSLELRARAAEYARYARSVPVGPSRNKLRRLARAFKALADNEAWLHGRIERRPLPDQRTARGA